MTLSLRLLNKIRLSKRPYNDPGSFEQFKHHWKCTHSLAASKHEYPCLSCGGYGKVRKEEERDQYEGYKLANWYVCESCNGSGEGTKEKWLEYYSEVSTRWGIDYAGYLLRHREEEQLLKHLEDVLTPLQQEILARII